MTSLDPVASPLASLECTALIVGFREDEGVVAHSLLDDAVRAHLTATARSLDAKFKAGSVTVLPGGPTKAGRVVVVGLGDSSVAHLREAAGAAARACGTKPTSVAIALPYADDAAAEAIAQSAVLGAYSFEDYKSGVTEEHSTQWLIAGASADVVERSRVVIGAVAGTRDLVNTPPIDLFPASFAEAAENLGSAIGVSVTTWDVSQLVDEGFGGLLAVGMGSSRLPRLVRVQWTSTDATQTVALVGKGITFDTGGISLKPPKAMETMKSDMAGAAAVLHTVLAAARAKLAVNVTGWLCLAENMPSGTAQRPSDVIRIYGGTTVEVLNTDAEGRLVLADGLVRACEDNPDVVIDVATLTGAQGLALGARTSGVMGTPAVRDEVVAAADAVDEPMWPMPLPEYLRSSLDSKVADMKNIGDTMAGMLTAGIFLKEFVGDTPWAHLDIARPAFNEGSAHGFTPPGGTGAAVRTLIQFLKGRAAR